MKQFFYRGAPVWTALGILVLWEAIVQLANVPMYLLPAPTDILRALAADFGPLMRHSAVTVYEALLGMGISFAVAIFIGILMDRFPLFKRCVYPILVVTQTVPVIVLAPLFIIYMGFGYGPKILTVVLMCFFPIAISFSDGLEQINEGYANLIRTYGGTRWQLYRIVKFPSAMITLLSGLKIAATYSISGAVVGEWIASDRGLGYYLIRAKNGYLLDKVFASIVLIIVLSLLMNGLVRVFARFAIPGSRRKNREV